MASRPIRSFAVVAVLVGGLLAAGCGSSSTTTSQPSGPSGSNTGSSASSAPTTAPSTSTPPTSGSTTKGTGSMDDTTNPSTAGSSAGSVDPAVQPIIDKAVADLAGRVGVPSSEITTVSAKAVTWPDSSLGCPQPGRNYLQVLVDGAQVELMAHGKRYDYHSGSDGQPVLCEQTFTGTAIPGESPTTG